MTALLDGWTLRPGVACSTLVAPEGPAAGVVRHHERVYPLRRLGDVVRERLAAYPDLQTVEVGAPERLVTAEGEHAALTRIRGQVSGRLAEVALGVVFADDFYSLYEGIAPSAEYGDRTADLVRRLVVDTPMWLGVRRRRAEYAPPAGWQPIVRGLVTDWLAPRFPAEHALVTVYPADPASGGSAARVLRRLLAKAIERGLEADPQAPEEEIEAESGLRGVAVEAIGLRHGAAALRAIAAVMDDTHVYGVELSSRDPQHWSDHREAFRKVWTSLRQIPAGHADPDGALAYLVE